MSKLTIRDDGSVRLLTMNRPEKRNALDNELTEMLLRSLEAAEADEGVKAIVLTGTPPAFCAGADTAEFKHLTGDNTELVEKRADLTTRLHSIFSRMTKPVVTAINGAAMGGGAGLAVAGDLAVMGESARIGYPEVKHGIVAAIVMASLVRTIGRKAAFELVSLGEAIDAQRALSLGMVNRVVADDRVVAEAMAMASKLAAVSVPAMATTKTLFYRSVDLPFADAMAEGRVANQRMRAFRSR